MSKINTLVTGGCRSGKSKHALSIARGFTGRKIYLATAEALDEEMRARIALHREAREKDWISVEEPFDVVSVLEREGNAAAVILIDCVTLWISNLLLKNNGRENILDRVRHLLDVCKRVTASVIVVTNEVGAGIVPENKLARDFRDIVGEANQAIATEFDEVAQVVSGIPVVIKSSAGWNHPGQSANSQAQEFPPEKKQGLYEAIFKRRDVRLFNSRPVDPIVLGRILQAAHHAGSVGYMQPWNFMVINDPQIKQSIRANFERCNEAAADKFQGDRQILYRKMKLEGITDAPINICVTCDGSRFGPQVLGRDTIPETDLFSACCAVQNLWLSARAEGIAIGWVSILSVPDLKRVLKIPDHIIPVAYLCVGHTDRFLDKPALETAGWGKRLNLDDLIYYNTWLGAPSGFTVKTPKDLPL